MDQLIADARSKMNKILEVVRNDLSTVRTGRAAPSLVENIVINAYGATQRLKVMELTTITTSDPQTLAVTPFDHSIIGEIQKGILEANVGLNPSCDGQIIRISIPPPFPEKEQAFPFLKIPRRISKTKNKINKILYRNFFFLWGLLADRRGSRTSSMFIGFNFKLVVFDTDYNHIAFFYIIGNNVRSHGI